MIRLHIIKLKNRPGSICPYCGGKKKGKATCGDPICQHKHHIIVLREYWDKFYRKTTRTYSTTRLVISKPISITCTKHTDTSAS